MDNRVNLIEYRRSYRSKEEIRNILYNLSKDMKRHHQNGEYIDDFSPRTISVCWTNPTDVVFTKYRRFGQIPLSDIITFKINDIKKLSLLAFCLFLDDYDLENGLLNMDVVKNSIGDNLNIFIDIDRDYYKSVFSSGNMFYYCDYVDGRISKLEDNNKNSTMNSELGVASYVILFSIMSLTLIMMLLFFSIKVF